MVQRKVNFAYAVAFVFVVPYFASCNKEQRNVRNVIRGKIILMQYL